MMDTPSIRSTFRTPCRSSTGMTLIEVLVALLIFSFGVLGLVGLQMRALQYSTSAQDSNRASLLANEMAFQMLNANTINPATNAASAYAAWQTRVASMPGPGLPQGVGTVAAAGTVGTITITWQAPSASGANAQNRYTTQVVLP